MKPETTLGAGVVSEVLYTTTFEAQTQLVIGLNKKTPYSTSKNSGRGNAKGPASAT